MKFHDDFAPSSAHEPATVTVTLSYSAALTLAAAFQVLLQNSAAPPLTCEGQCLASAILLRDIRESPIDHNRARVTLAQADAYSALHFALGPDARSKIAARIAEGFGQSGVGLEN